MSDFLYKKIVIKVGSNVLTDNDGQLDVSILEQLTSQIGLLKKNHIEVILVSSGAVASGRGLVKLSEKSDSVASRQVLAAVGQVKLLNHYYELFSRTFINCAQVLVTKEDFRDRTHYLNMRNCFTALLQNNILPIVNENDVISVTELMFTDNDELAALIASMINAEALIILSNVDGIYDGDPKNPSSKVISTVDNKVDFSKYISSSKSDFGRGGMITKSNMARKVSQNGIIVKIANGKKPNILIDALKDKNYTVGTSFLPIKSTSNTKKQIAFSETFAKGEVVVNEGAKLALFSEKATSLLTVGVVKVKGDFQSGDVVKITDESGKTLGLGKVQYNAKRADELKGQKNQKPLVHYDYLYLNM